jgi:hypothetical protein
MSWHKDIKSDIIGIPMEDTAPSWDCSSSTPEEQLQQLSSMGFVDGFRDYKKDPAFANLVEGKRVAIVGPSPHLSGLGNGMFIDSYDIVIRLNQKFAMPKDKWADYGSKTDIMFGSFNDFNRIECDNNIDYIKSLKHLVCPMLSMWDIKKQEDWFDSTGVPWHNVCDGYLFKMFKEVGTTCNTGFSGIVTLMNYDIKEVYVTGMTFFDMGKWGNVYFDEYYDSVKSVTGDLYGVWNSDRLIDGREARDDLHAQLPQIKYFNKMLQKYYPSKITVDDYLTNAYSLR